MQLGDARAGKLADNIFGFARALRRAGLPIDSARIGLAQEAVTAVGVHRRADLAACLEAVFVSHERDREVFAELFEAFFRDPEIAKQLMAQLLPSSKAQSLPAKRGPRASEALMPPQAAMDTTARSDELRLDAAMSASNQMRLKHADFQSLNASEYRLMEQLIRRVPLEIPRIRSRRYISAAAGVRLDWPRWVRDCGRLCGEAAPPRLLQRDLRPEPLLILVDVSGSMERYARLMLAFLHRATQGLPRSVFAFGVELTDLRLAFRERDTDRMFSIANTLISDFAAGTRLGESLQTLRKHHRNALMGRRTLTLIITDGLDTGDNTLLLRELDWLSRQSRHLLWLNPLLRFDGYQPLASGAQALSRYADQMLAIHNLSKVESLANGLADLISTKSRIRSPGPQRPQREWT